MSIDEDSRLIAFGQVLNFFKMEAGWNVAVLGKEFAASFHKLVKRQVAILNIQDNVLVSYKGRVEDDSVDMLLCGDTFETVTSQALKEILRALKVGSVAVFVEKAQKKEEIEEKFKDKLSLFPKHLLLNLSQYHNGIVLKK